MDYLDKNKAYWEKGYNAPNVDHPVFRFYGRILKPQFGLGGNWERLVDFGCGQGASVNYFHQHGFNARGVDVSEANIMVCKVRYPHIAECFRVCQAEPKANDAYGFDEDIAVITAIQSLYYLSDTHLSDCLELLHAAMRPGGVFFATMMGRQSRDFYDNSTEYEDGLRVVNFQTSRMHVNDYYINFTHDENDLKRKFAMFRPVHIGYYTEKFRSDEGEGFHFTFCGVK